ncbi:uncharacterized protein LY89DRAFT_733048 [Mollisia scopiformis]|uniref:Uncharacterized protein n=1 Tax=Mollisia scopiformis TaxID=149040 RepID=A0A194XDX0_MOLSC|nr:uncharacterized protein LY89DRAFT_733048 [Mollisia scopiformis]KUJ18373.1 hypothetical protein LY89DRAFT_733048 [Mollisia scopiformis]
MIAVEANLALDPMLMFKCCFNSTSCHYDWRPLSRIGDLSHLRVATVPHKRSSWTLRRHSTVIALYWIFDPPWQQTDDASAAERLSMSAAPFQKMSYRLPCALSAAGELAGCTKSTAMRTDFWRLRFSISKVLHFLSPFHQVPYDAGPETGPGISKTYCCDQIESQRRVS